MQDPGPKALERTGASRGNFQAGRSQPTALSCWLVGLRQSACRAPDRRRGSKPTRIFPRTSRTGIEPPCIPAFASFACISRAALVLLDVLLDERDAALFQVGRGLMTGTAPRGAVDDDGGLRDLGTRGARAVRTPPSRRATATPRTRRASSRAPGRGPAVADRRSAINTSSAVARSSDRDAHDLARGIRHGRTLF